MDASYEYGMWVAVAVSVALFVFFMLSFLAPQGRAEWRGFGVVTAFLVALFTEMYGFPLTIYLLTGWLGEAYPVLAPFNHKYGHLWVVVFGGSTLAWVVVMALSLMLMIAGYLLLSRGWQQVHRGRGSMITDGLYAYVRHPQYTGLFLVIAGFLVQWPTLLTVVMAPVLLYAHRHLARNEEQHMLARFGDAYHDYMRCVPAFFPPLQRWKPFLMTQIPE